MLPFISHGDRRMVVIIATILGGSHVDLPIHHCAYESVCNEEGQSLLTYINLHFCFLARTLSFIFSCINNE